MNKSLFLVKGMSFFDILIIVSGFIFCLFPIFILLGPTYTQSACDTVREGHEIYFERNKTPSYLEESNANVLNALKENCPNLNIY